MVEDDIVSIINDTDYVALLLKIKSELEYAATNPMPGQRPLATRNKEPNDHHDKGD